MHQFIFFSCPLSLVGLFVIEFVVACIIAPTIEKVTLYSRSKERNCMASFKEENVDDGVNHHAVGAVADQHRSEGGHMPSLNFEKFHLLSTFFAF